MLDPITLSVAGIAAGMGLFKTGLDIFNEVLDVKTKFKKPTPTTEVQTASETGTNAKNDEPSPVLRRSATLPVVIEQVEIGDAMFQTQTWIQTVAVISFFAWTIRLMLGEAAQSMALVATMPLMFTIVYITVRRLGVSIVLNSPQSQEPVTTSPAQSTQAQATASSSVPPEESPPPLPKRRVPAMVTIEQSSTPNKQQLVLLNSKQSEELTARRHKLFCAGALKAQKSPISPHSSWERLTEPASRLEKLTGLRTCSTCNRKIPLEATTIPTQRWTGKAADIFMWPRPGYTGLSIPQMKYLSHMKSTESFTMDSFACFLCGEPMKWPLGHLETHTVDDFTAFRQTRE